MRVMGFLLLGLWSAAGLAQTMYKCVDAQRRITYSNITCEKQGLKDAGPVADRTTSMPFTALPKPAAAPLKPAPGAEPPGGAAKTAVPPASTDEAEAGRGGAVQIKPVNPLIEKLLK